MQKTKAVIANGAGGPEVLTIVDYSLPALGPNEMIVRVHAAGINRPDVMQRQGNYAPPPGASEVLGLELSGTVELVGSNVSRFAPGDRVMALVASGAYAEHAVVHEDVALAIPDGIGFVEAGAVPETYFTVWSNVFERAALASGETLLVHGGTSGIGTTAIQLAKALGAGRVIATAGSDEKCAACLELGADNAINYRTSDFVKETRELTDGRGPDVILDMIGAPYFQKNLDLVALDGRIAQIAFQNGSRADVDLAPLLFKRVTMTGSTLRARPVAMKARLARALEERVMPLLGARKVLPVIDSVYKFTNVADAHSRMDGGNHVGKIVLAMSDEAQSEIGGATP